MKVLQFENGYETMSQTLLFINIVNLILLAEIYQALTFSSVSIELENIRSI